jgi:hypothetical protein
MEQSDGPSGQIQEIA